MNRLPDVMVIDFCEWLKNHVASQQERREIDVLDMIFDEKHYSELVKYSEKYLSEDNHPIRSLLHCFIDSEEFGDYLHKCYSIFTKYQQSRHWSRSDELSALLHECYHGGRLDFFFDMFLQNNKRSEQDILFNDQISPWDLAANVRDVLEQNDRQQLLRYMSVLNVDLSVEVDFVEWLIRTHDKPVKISKMPLKIFEKLALQYLVECGKDESDKQKLIKAFKQSDSDTLVRKILKILPQNTAKRALDLGYVIDRYADSQIPYRCVILPLAADSREYIDLMENRWYDLHYMSGNLLDIYYSKTDYGKSGYEIMKRLNFIPRHLSGKLPSIILWQNDMNKAKGINIHGLDNSDVFEVISKIVSLIQVDTPFESIIQEAEALSSKRREKNRAITNNTLSFGGDNYGVAVVDNSGQIIMAPPINTDSTLFVSEAKEAITRIEKLEELTEQQKTALIEIINEAKEAVEVDSEEGKEKSKARFKDAMRFLGNVSVKLLSSLSALANLAKFFGFVIP